MHSTVHAILSFCIHQLQSSDQHLQVYKPETEVAPVALHCCTREAVVMTGRKPTAQVPSVCQQTCPACDTAEPQLDKTPAGCVGFNSTDDYDSSLLL